MSDTKVIVWLAILSRILILVLQSLSNYLIPDHDANVFISPKLSMLNGNVCHTIVDKIVGGFKRWDGEYFLHIAEHGYTYEHTLVFYPFFPFCVRYMTNLVKLMETIIGIECEFNDLSLLIAVSLNIVFFTKAALVLHQLSIEIFNNYRLARITTTLFCFNPASIFFSAPYSESLYCWMSFSVMLYCSKNQIQFALLPFVLGLWCRSNGFINIGFILYNAIRDIWSKNNRNWTTFVCGFVKVLFYAIVAGVAFAIVQSYFYTLYCEGKPFEMNEAIRNYGIENNFVLAGKQKAKWCSYDLPFSYSYLQSHYWNVGLLKYYELKQIPNFLLASPILTMIIYHSIKFLLANPKIALHLGLFQTSNNREKTKHFVYLVHALALCIFCLLFVHIQVSTRMLASSSPYIYWICAQHFLRERHQNSWKAFLQPKSRITKFIKAWFFGYFIIGTILFSNFLPWT